MLNRSCFFSGESVEGWGLANQLSESDGKHLCQDQSPALKAAKGEGWDSSTWLLKKMNLNRNSFFYLIAIVFLLDRNSTRLGLSRTPLTLSSMRSSASSSPGFSSHFLKFYETIYPYEVSHENLAYHSYYSGRIQRAKCWGSPCWTMTGRGKGGFKHSEVVC